MSLAKWTDYPPNIALAQAKWDRGITMWRAHQAGATLREISNKCGLCKNRVWQIIQMQDAALRQGRKSPAEAHIYATVDGRSPPFAAALARSIEKVIQE